MNTLQKIQKARANGCKIPFRTMRAANATGVPFHVLCAFLEQESGGGANVFGHDPTIFVGAGTVTKSKYLAYKAQRKAGKGMQGVGPMQLTWYSYQDQADALGGCWKPYNNLLVGARLLASYYKATQNWVLVGQKYNGAYSYGLEVKAKIDKWARILA